jgi:hypothetical protein
MNMMLSRGRAALVLSIILIAAAAGAGFAQATPPAPINGTIAALSGSSVTLTLADMTTKTVVLKDNTLVLERDVAMLDQVRTGDAIAVTSHRSGTEFVASQINIFAKEMLSRGIRMDQWLMVSGDWMTNGTVAGLMQGMNGHTVTMTYPTGTSTITVPDGIKVHRFLVVKPGSLAVGMQISVRGMPATDGTITAASISYDAPAKS